MKGSPKGGEHFGEALHHQFEAGDPQRVSLFGRSLIVASDDSETNREEFSCDARGIA